MSLDVELVIKGTICDKCGSKKDDEIVFERNITHNLSKMAKVCGVYHACWKPEAINCFQAKHILPLLEQGLANMECFPDFYKQFNASNSWGVYEHFIKFLTEYINACKEYPETIIKVSR